MEELSLRIGMSGIRIVEGTDVISRGESELVPVLPIVGEEKIQRVVDVHERGERQTLETVDSELLVRH